MTAPAKAAIITIRLPVNLSPAPISPAAPNVPPRASITMATPSEAPLLIPRTDGPASGLRK